MGLYPVSPPKTPAGRETQTRQPKNSGIAVMYSKNQGNAGQETHVGEAVAKEVSCKILQITKKHVKTLRIAPSPVSLRFTEQ